jgi:AcrR family transcriptional regulator
VPRAGLSRDRVVASAAAIADEVGLENLTLAAVAEHHGVALPSLYKHVRGAGDLRRALAIRGVHDLADTMGRAAQGRAGVDALRTVAIAYRHYAHRHPGTYAGTVRAPDADDEEHTEAAARLLAVVFAVLAGYGIDGDDAIDATRALHATLHGFVTLEREGSFKMARSVDTSFSRILDALDDAFQSWGTHGPGRQVGR